MEKLLIACVGGTAGLAKHGDRPCGLLEQGFCVPLAATEKMMGLVEASGEDTFGEWLQEQGIVSPPAGGLWVLEVEEIIDEDEADDCDECETQLNGWRWRLPTPREIDGVQCRGLWRVARHQKDVENMELAECSDLWTFVGGRA
jgi:hypothetical protein